MLIDILATGFFNQCKAIEKYDSKFKWRMKTLDNNWNYGGVMIQSDLIANLLISRGNAKNKGMPYWNFNNSSPEFQQAGSSTKFVPFTH